MYISVNDKQMMVITKAVDVLPWRKQCYQYFLTSDFFIRQYDTLNANSYTNKYTYFYVNILSQILNYILTILNYTIFNV